MKYKFCSDCPYEGDGYVRPQLKRNSKILFVGQNPEEQEVESGYPFYKEGDCGRFIRNYFKELDKKSIRYSITYCFKCHIPNNKAPSKKDIARCKPALLADIKKTNPELIVVLGKSALVAMTGLTTGILKLNGKILRDYPIPILVCVHPRYVFCNGYSEEKKKKFEKGILPALHYFDEVEELEVKKVSSLPPDDEKVGFDIETTEIKPHLGIIKCFSVSDGKTATFVPIKEGKKC